MHLVTEKVYPTQQLLHPSSDVNRLPAASVQQHCAVRQRTSTRTLGQTRQLKRPPESRTTCPYWDRFRWSQQAARKRSESHSGLNWTHHGTGAGCGSVLHRAAHRQGLFQLKLMLADHRITSGFRVAGHIWRWHMVSQTAPRDYMAPIWQKQRRIQNNTEPSFFTV